jgi:glycosyltransferase involved in cell wall biosynthesis
VNNHDQVSNMEKLKKPLVLIPAFNEAGRIEPVIRGIKEHLPDADILVVDDGSTDATAAVSRQSGAMVISHAFNLGVGTALQTGYKYALKAGYHSLVQLDGDGQHDPAQINLLLSALEKTRADLVIGSRFLPDSNHSMTYPRKTGVRLFAWLLSVLIHERITDPTSGFRAMSQRVLQFCTQDIYGFDYPDADFLLTLHRAGYRLSEVPIEVKPRMSGKSQYHGLKPVYYFIKMFLSIFIILLRKKTIKKA